MFGVQASCRVELCTLRLGNAKLTTFKSHDVAVNMAEKHWSNTMWTLWLLNHCHMNCHIMWVKYGTPKPNMAKPIWTNFCHV